MGLTVCCLETRERVRRLSEKTPLNAAAKHVSLRPEASFHKPGFAAAFFAGYLVIGTIVFKYTENYGWRDAFYFAVTTFTTVGYGDLFPTSDAARIFNIFYILFGLSVVATCVGAIVAWAEAEARDRYGDKEKMQKNVRNLTYSLLRHVAALFIILGVGAVWYTVMENASVLDGIYWATITSASPHSPATRARDARMAHNNVDVVRRCRFDCGLRRLPNQRSDPHLQLLLYRRRSLRP